MEWRRAVDTSKSDRISIDGGSFKGIRTFERGHVAFDLMELGPDLDCCCYEGFCWWSEISSALQQQCSVCLYAKAPSSPSKRFSSGVAGWLSLSIDGAIVSMD